MRILSSLLRRFGSAADFNAIKSATEKHARRHDHDAYERALVNYDAGLHFEEAGFTKAFVGSGKGQYTLNSYRKINGDGRILFEKVYSLDSPDWRKCQFFFEQVHPRMDVLDIQVPALICSLRGHHLVVARFEFVDFSPVDPELYIEEVLRLTNAMSSLGPAWADVPAEFMDLTQHFGFERCFQKSLGMFEEDEEKVGLLRSLRARCEALPRFLGHGDMSRPNMGGRRLVLDWDNFGFYPPGFDLALALVLQGDLLKEHELVRFARQGHKAVMEYCTFDDFLFSLVLLYGLFLSTRKAEHKIYCFGLLGSRFLASSREAVLMD